MLGCESKLTILKSQISFCLSTFLTMPGKQRKGPKGWIALASLREADERGREACNKYNFKLHCGDFNAVLVSYANSDQFHGKAARAYRAYGHGFSGWLPRIAGFSYDESGYMLNCEELRCHIRLEQIQANQNQGAVNKMKWLRIVFETSPVRIAICKDFFV